MNKKFFLLRLFVIGIAITPVVFANTFHYHVIIENKTPYTSNDVVVKLLYSNPEGRNFTNRDIKFGNIYPGDKRAVYGDISGNIADLSMVMVYLDGLACGPSSGAFVDIPNGSDNAVIKIEVSPFLYCPREVKFQ